MNKTYVNLRVDTKNGAWFFYALYKGKCKLIGERYGDYCVQFKTITAAKRAVLAYRAYLEQLGYGRRETTDYLTASFAELGNHSAQFLHKLDELKSNLFYLNY